MTRILVTGAAGFIGFHVMKKLALNNIDVVGVDNFNNYYSASLKHARARELKKYSLTSSQILEIDIADKKSVEQLADFEFTHIIHLAAQAGVRYSTENPSAYVISNLIGFSNILELARKLSVKHLIYASSSSVYGESQLGPFSEEQRTDSPISFYAATKKANEVMAYSYSHLYSIPSSGIRFFTVYGPWGRPDMAYWTFTKAILENKPINIYNQGKSLRDFTYIDDVVSGIENLINIPPQSNQSFTRIINFGNNNPVTVQYFIECLEKCLQKESIKNILPHQPGDVSFTHANIKNAKDLLNYSPQTDLKQGLSSFVAWYKTHPNDANI